MTDAAIQPITEADLMALDEDQRFEVVDGVLVEGEMTAGFTHAAVIDNLYDLIKPHVKQNALGYFHTDSVTFILNRDTEGNITHSRIPDTFFLRADAMPDDYDRSRPFPGTPTLAVEVVSPHEKANTIQGKVRDYLRFGSEQVWVLYPQQGTLHQYISGESVAHIYQAGDTLQAEALFPGLRIAVAALFEEE